MLSQSYLTDRSYTSKEIINIQRALNENTHLIPNRVELTLTGIIDEATQELLKVFQEYRRFEVTGTYTARTSMFLNEFIKNKYLSDNDRLKLIKSTGLDAKVVTAMAYALSGPHGFVSNGRCSIRYDVSGFLKRYQTKHGKGKMLKLIKENEVLLDSPTLPEYQLERWTQMEALMKLGYEEMLESTYYGLGAVSGAKWKALRIRSIYEFLGQVQSSEYDQFSLFLIDIASNKTGLLNAVKRKDLSSIATYYKDQMPEATFIKQYRHWLERL